jgi:TetR/AcrR family transcriptional regulator
MSSTQLGSSDPRPSAGEEAILQAAIQLFSENGFDGVSMRSVALAAGVSKSNIYHHFQSKEALYLAIMHDSARRLSDLVENLAEGEGSFDQRLRVFAQAHIRHLFENATTLRLFLREAFSGDEEKGRMLVEQVVGGIYQRLISIFREGQEAGLVRPELDPGLCALLIMGGDLFYFQSYDVLNLLPQANFARRHEQYSEEMMDIILSGMMVPTGQPGETS